MKKMLTLSLALCAGLLFGWEADMQNKKLQTGKNIVVLNEKNQEGADFVNARLCDDLPQDNAGGICRNRVFRTCDVDQAVVKPGFCFVRPGESHAFRSLPAVLN